MKLKQVTIENYRAIEHLELPLHPQLTVLHGDNGHGKTSVLSAIAVGLGQIAWYLRIRYPRMPRRMVRRRSRDVQIVETDGRTSGPTKILLTSADGTSWHIPISREDPANPALATSLKRIMDSDQIGEAPRDLPIVAFYDTERAVIDEFRTSRFFRQVSLDEPMGGPRDLTLESEWADNRYYALVGALSAHADFQDFFDWFFIMENVELRHQREERNFDFRLPQLSAVREAIEEMIPGATQLRVQNDPFRFVVTMAEHHGRLETLAIEQLSGGYRIVLAMTADLARRMAQGNPHLKNPLESEAIVLIDEIDLHLHPAWQQRVLPDLMRTFPNAQFIVSTHSPQVLTTVKPEHIVSLYREGNDIITDVPGAPTYGAESGYVLSTVMGVKERPASEHNEFVDTLERYNALVYGGQGKTAEALELRAKLESLSPRDLALDSADSEMRRQEVMERLGRGR